MSAGGNSDFDDSREPGTFVGIQTALLKEADSIDSEFTDSNFSGLQNIDPWSDVDGCSPSQVHQLAQILEVRGAQPRQIKMREACLTAAKIAKGSSILEIGSGTGIVCRELSSCVGEQGEVIGIDPSEGLLDFARRASAAPNLDYQKGSAYALDFEDERFDYTIAATLFAHLKDHANALQEMLRVTRGGGGVMLLDQDYGTLPLDHSDMVLTQRILFHGSVVNVVNPLVGRALTGWLEANPAVENVRCWPFVYHERDARSYLITIAQRFAALAVTNRIISEDESDGWLEELYERDSKGMFYSSLNYYFAWGDKKQA